MHNRSKLVNDSTLQLNFKQITANLFVFLFSFLILTSPITIMGLFLYELSTVQHLFTYINIAVSIQITFCVINIFILYSNRTFRDASRKFLKNSVDIIEIIVVS